jgi:hypothetical protein
MVVKPDEWYTGIVHLENLPDNIRLDLEDSLKKDIIYAIKKETRYLFEFSEKIKEPIHYAKQGKYISRNAYILKNFINGSCISLRLLKKLSFFFVSKGYKNFDLRNIEKNIKLIKAGKNGTPVFKPTFPINFNSEDGGKFISAILCDGGIDINHISSYRNENIELRRIVAEAAKNIFGIFYIDTSKSQIKFPTIISKILISIGMSFGKKTINNVGIPNFILKIENEYIIKKFLQQAFDDEGSVTGKTNRAKHIALELSVDVINFSSSNETVPQLLLDIIKLLKRLKIQNSGPYFSREHICKDGRIKHSWSIYIGNIDNLRCFLEKVNFSSSAKSKKLEDSIKEIEKSLEKRHEPRKDIIKKIVKVQNKYGKITARNLSEDFNIKLSTASSWLTRLERDGEIRKIYYSWKPKDIRRAFILNK